MRRIVHARLCRRRHDHVVGRSEFGEIRSTASTIVTFEPKRENICPNSSPTAPARIDTWYVPKPRTRSLLIADSAVNGEALPFPALRCRVREPLRQDDRMQGTT